MDSKPIYFSTKSVPRRARSLRLRQAGLTSLKVDRITRQTANGLSSLWFQHEETRKQLRQRADTWTARDNEVTTELGDLKISVQGQSYRVMDADEVKNLCNNILNLNNG